MPRPREFEPEQVLEQAMRHFWERGYRATSVGDLVEATGVRPGSLYSAFPGGKRALFLGSLDRYSKLIVPQKLRDLGGPGASVAEVRAYFDGLVADLLSPEGRRGEIPASTRVTGVARLLVATSQGLMVVGKANPNKEMLNAIVNNAFAALA
jgi:TetR/AcrR family transcriptional repressor of nem operon